MEASAKLLEKDENNQGCFRLGKASLIFYNMIF